MNSESSLMTSDECAAMLRISKRQLRRLTASRKIPVISINQRVKRFQREQFYKLHIRKPYAGLKKTGVAK